MAKTRRQRTVSTIRDLARALNRGKSVVARWMRHPEWPFPRAAVGRKTTWDVDAVARWARRSLVGDAQRPTRAIGGTPVDSRNAVQPGAPSGKAADVSALAGANGNGQNSGAAATAAGGERGNDDGLEIDPSELDQLGPMWRAKLRQIITRTARDQLELSIRSGRYIAREDVDRSNVARVAAVRARLLELPKRIRPLLGGLRNADAVTVRIEDEIVDMLAEFAREPHRSAES